jgi:conjugative transfer region protein TrbK
VGRTAKLAVVALVAGVMAATAIKLALDERPLPAPRPAPATKQEDADPLRAELARCRGLAADEEDEDCEAAWEEHRRRFFARGRGEAR